MKIDSDWPYYGTVEELLESATFVFVGKITDISFAVMGYTEATGEPYPGNKVNSDLRLETFYSVEAETVYKGNAENLSGFWVMFGVPNYKEEEQLKIMRDRGYDYPEGKIPVLNNYEGYKTGETYLFVLKTTVGNYTGIMNLDQSLYCLSNPDVKTRTYDRPLPFGAEDIVRTFGEDKLAEFTAKYGQNKNN